MFSKTCFLMATSYSRLLLLALRVTQDFLVHVLQLPHPPQAFPSAALSATFPGCRLRHPKWPLRPHFKWCLGLRTPYIYSTADPRGLLVNPLIFATKTTPKEQLT